MSRSDYNCPTHIPLVYIIRRVGTFFFLPRRPLRRPLRALEAPLRRRVRRHGRGADAPHRRPQRGPALRARRLLGRDAARVDARPRRRRPRRRHAHLRPGPRTGRLDAVLGIPSPLELGCRFPGKLASSLWFPTTLGSCYQSDRCEGIVFGPSFSSFFSSKFAASTVVPCCRRIGPSLLRNSPHSTDFYFRRPGTSIALA